MGRGWQLQGVSGPRTQSDPFCPVPRAVDTTSFEIISTFPPTVYSDNTVTLQAAGLVPNAALLLRTSRAPLPAPGPSSK